MINNPFVANIELENDIEDFKMPYRLYGKTDEDVMTMKYKKLSNRGHGLIVRLKR